MISSILYLFKELILSLNNKALTFFAASVAAIFIFLGLLAFYQLLGNNPNYVEKTEVLAILENGAGQGEINDVYRSIRGWAEISEVEFIFAEETERNLKFSQNDLDSDYFRVVVSNPDLLEQVTSKLEGMDEIVGVKSHQEGFVDKVLTLNSQTKIGAYLILAFFLILTFLLLRSLVKRTVQGWVGELEALHYSGAERRFAYVPFFITTTLAGLLGGLITVAVIYLFHNWAIGHPYQAGNILPALLNPSLILGLSLRVSIFGVLIGILSGIFSIRIIKNLR